MKNIFLALFIAFATQSVFAQPTQKVVWKPESFSKLSEIEQRIISNLTPINQKNKAFVQLLLDAGTYSTCGVGTALRQDKIFVSVIDKVNSKKYSYIIDFDKALVNEDPFFDNVSGSQMHALAFDQRTKSLTGEISTETVLMYFFFGPSNTLDGMAISTKKNTGFYPIISKITGKTETSYEIKCKAK